MKEYNDRCHKCDQPKSTHDDGECAGVTRSMLEPSMRPQAMPLQAQPEKEEPKGLDKYIDK